MTKPKPRGRPEHTPTDHTREQVKALAAMGATLFEVSTVMQLSEPTLQKYYATELATGAIQANAKVAQSLYRQATRADKPNVTAAIFWLKARAGWRDGSRGSGAEDDEPPGKKAIAREEAKTAAIGTPWEEVLGGPGANSLQ